MHLILASTSTWRLQLLKDAGIPCQARDPGVDESEILAPDPVGLARLRAEAKALAVARDYPKDWVVGADQVAHLDGVMFGKPADRNDWGHRLRSLVGRDHQLTTGVAVHGPSGLELWSETTQVRFRNDIEDWEIEAYMDWGEARNCAGGYMVERRGAWLVEQCEGDWNNVIGLPVLRLVSTLRRMGWRMPKPDRGRA